MITNANICKSTAHVMSARSNDRNNPPHLRTSIEFLLESETRDEIYTQDLDMETSIGVAKAEILARQVESGWKKVVVLISAFLVGYAYGLDGQTRYVFTGYATASYQKHSLMSTVNVISAVTGAACQPIFARLSDIFGRLELFLVAISFYVIGTVIESEAYDVQRYCAGDIFYTIGYGGSILQILLILGDVSPLKWRLFFSFVPSFPFIINTWISGNITDAIGMNWTKGIVMWAYLYPIACLPMLCCMMYMRYSAGKTKEWENFHKRKTKLNELGTWKCCKYLFWRLDLVGISLMTVILGLLLVPLTIAGGTESKWERTQITTPLACGVLLVPIFITWESYCEYSIAPISLLNDRGIWSGLFICFLLNFISAVESGYIYTVLMVALNESQMSATRMVSLAPFVSVICSIPFGLAIVKLQRLKRFILLGCALWIIGLAVMIRYRAGLDSHNGIVGALCIMGFGTTFFTYPVTVSLQSCTSHEYMALVTSLGFTVYKIGAAVGSAVSGAIWTQMLYKEIVKELNGDIELAKKAYRSPYVFVVDYAWGTSERAAVVEAYKSVQEILLVIALCFCIPMMACALFLRDNRLGDEQSTQAMASIKKNEPGIMLDDLQAS